MKFRLKLFVLFLLFVSVAIGSVAFFGVRSNAVNVIPTWDRYMNNVGNSNSLLREPTLYLAGRKPTAVGTTFNSTTTEAWHNLNQGQNVDMTVYNSFQTYTSGGETIDQYNYVDYDGYHFHNFMNDKECSIPLAAVITNAQSHASVNGWAIQIYLGDFIDIYNNSSKDNTILQIKGSTRTRNSNYQSSSPELLLFYRTGSGLGLKYPVALNASETQCSNVPTYISPKTVCGKSHTITYSTNNDFHKRIFVDLSEDDLKDTLITIACIDDAFRSYNNRDTSHTNNKIFLFINDTKVYESNEEAFHQQEAALFTSISAFKLGCNSSGRCSKFLVRSLRTFNFTYTSESTNEPQLINDVKNIYNYEHNLYSGTGPVDFSATPSKQNVSYGITGLDKTKNATLPIHVEDLSGENNEILSDFDISTGLSFTKDEILKYENAPPAYLKTLDNTKVSYLVRATFAKLGSSTKNVSRTQSGNYHNQVHTLSSYKDIHNEAVYTKADDNAVLFCENSYYLRGKYKCGSSEIKKTDDVIDFTQTTKLMLTSTIMPYSLHDVDFCGMVVDYSDKIWNYYGPNQDYSGQIWDGKFWVNDPMFTQFDQNETSTNNYTKSSLFPTGVGFNLVRPSSGYTADSDGMFDQNLGIIMRIFVGGDGTSNSTKFLDLKFKDLGISNTQTYNEFTIYRMYEKWNYGAMGGISNGQYVYLVKFYLNKNCVAMVAMPVNEVTSNGKTYFECTGKGNGVIFKCSKNLPVATGCVTGTMTFKNWFESNDYGFEGHYRKLSGNSETFATPSGNVLIALHKANKNIDDDDNTYALHWDKKILKKLLKPTFVK